MNEINELFQQLVKMNFKKGDIKIKLTFEENNQKKVLKASDSL